MRPQGKDRVYKSKRLSSHCNMLYPPFGRIDFISVSPLRLECLEISLHWHAENTSSITKNISLCFLPGGVCSKAHEFKHMKTWVLGIYVLPSSFPSHNPLPHRLPTKMNSSYYAPLKSNGNTNSVCKWLFLISVCSCENTVRSCMPVTVCACVFCIDCCWYVGKWA